MLKFEWDENKNATNIQKHHVSFKEAVSIFYDENALIISDPEHSDFEERFILIGFSYLANVLTVCHCYRENDEVIRIISARKATKKEIEQYLERV